MKGVYRPVVCIQLNDEKLLGSYELFLVSETLACLHYHLEDTQILDSNCWFTMRFPLFQEQIAACHEFDGVRKEKERLTAAYWSRELQLHHKSKIILLTTGPP